MYRLDYSNRFGCMCSLLLSFATTARAYVRSCTSLCVLPSAVACIQEKLDLGLLTRAGSQPHQVASRYQQPWDGKLRHHTSIYFILATYAGSNARRYRLLCVRSHRGPTGPRSWGGGPDGSNPYRWLDAGGTTRVGDGQNGIDGHWNRRYVVTCRDLIDLCFFKI
jgi:hypothetical protein